MIIPDLLYRGHAISMLSTFFFATSFDIGSSDNVLRAQWPLGVALGELNDSDISNKIKSKL